MVTTLGLRISDSWFMMFHNIWFMFAGVVVLFIVYGLCRLVEADDFDDDDGDENDDDDDYDNDEGDDDDEDNDVVCFIVFVSWLTFHDS